MKNEYDFHFFVDETIPFVPEFIWVYHTLLPVIILTIAFLIKTRRDFLITYSSFIIAALTMYAFYILFPSHYPRPELINPDSSASLWLVDATRTIDAANNTFPSSHVTYSWLLLISVVNMQYINQKIKYVYLLWAMLIAVSTVTLKQHYVLDVVSGLLLSHVSYYLAKRTFHLLANKGMKLYAGTNVTRYSERRDTDSDQGGPKS